MRRFDAFVARRIASRDGGLPCSQIRRSAACAIEWRLRANGQTLTYQVTLHVYDVLYSVFWKREKEREREREYIYIYVYMHAYLFTYI